MLPYRNLFDIFLYIMHKNYRDISIIKTHTFHTLRGKFLDFFRAKVRSHLIFCPSPGDISVNAPDASVTKYNFELLQELQEEYQEFGIQLNLIESLEDSFIAE